MRVLICGSRKWTAEGPVREFVAALPEGCVVIEGAARGADRIAAHAARDRGLEVEAYPADWARFGPKAAGPIRNRAMLTQGHPEQVWAFCDDLAGSRGTKDMVEAGLAAGLPVWVVDSSGATTRLSRSPDRELRLPFPNSDIWVRLLRLGSPDPRSFRAGGTGVYARR